MKRGNFIVSQSKRKSTTWRWRQRPLKPGFAKPAPQSQIIYTFPFSKSGYQSIKLIREQLSMRILDISNSQTADPNNNTDIKQDSLFDRQNTAWLMTRSLGDSTKSVHVLCLGTNKLWPIHVLSWKFYTCKINWHFETCLCHFSPAISRFLSYWYTVPVIR